MKKQFILKIVNLCLFLTFLTAAVSMVLYRWGPESLQGTETIYEIHGVSGIVLFILVLIHFILNGKWVINAYFKKKE